MANYRAGIIGLGFIGAADQISGTALGQRVIDLDGTHLNAVQSCSRVELIAGASRDVGRRQRFAARTGARTYEAWSDLLESEKLDLVCVATYAPHHAEIVKACAALGIRAIFCEKPIATRLSDGEDMFRSCNENGVLLAINHNRRYNPNHRRLRDLVVDGALGELTSVSMQWGNGRLGNVGTHMIDGLQMLLNQPVAAISATLDLTRKPDCRGDNFIDPGGWGLLRMADGLKVTIDAPDYGRTPSSTVINGTIGRAMVTGLAVDIEYWDGRSEHWPNLDTGSSMDRAVAEIVAWLDGSDFPYDAAEAVHTLQVIVACHASHAQQSAWVELPLTGAKRDIEVRSG